MAPSSITPAGDISDSVRSTRHLPTLQAEGHWLLARVWALALLQSSSDPGQAAEKSRPSDAEGRMVVNTVYRKAGSPCPSQPKRVLVFTMDPSKVLMSEGAQAVCVHACMCAHAGQQQEERRDCVYPRP